MTMFLLLVHRPLSLLLLLSLVLASVMCSCGLVESERVEEYYRRGHTWPPRIIPDNPGWKALYEKRFEQVQQLEDIGAKYDAWIESITSGVVMPNFTEFGWGVTRTQPDLINALVKGIREGLDTARLENEVDIIYGATPLFIDRPDLTERVLHEMKPIVEAWSGVELVPYRAYGFRLYRNESRLLMHIDKTNTHVVSCILHIDSSEDAEPWPIIIEDLAGNTHEAILTSGDVLLYESGKCFHGRPTKFNGSWYSSIFVHYYPAGEWSEIDHELDSHYAVPPTWQEVKPANHSYPKLEMVGTGMLEPDCPDLWCDLNKTVKWHGPAELDYVITTGPNRYPLYKKQRDEL